MCVFNNSLQATRKIRDRSPENNLNNYKQNGKRVWLNVLYLVIWYPNENLLHLYKSCFFNYMSRILLILVNIIYADEADFR